MLINRYPYDQEPVCVLGTEHPAGDTISPQAIAAHEQLLRDNTVYEVKDELGPKCNKWNTGCRKIIARFGELWRDYRTSHPKSETHHH
jgi:hypothetical protein